MTTENPAPKGPPLSKVRRVVEECVLLEYSCCPYGVNQYAVVEQVSKSLEVPPHVWDALGIDLKALEEAHQLEQVTQLPLAELPHLLRILEVRSQLFQCLARIE